MMEIQKILILIDLSEETPSLFTYGLQLAQAWNAEVWVQHIYYIPPDLAGEVFIPMDALKKYEHQAHKAFEQLKESANLSTDREPHFLISHGDFVVQANQLIDQEGIDLVMVGNRGGGYSANILGSHTLKAIYHIHGPVLSVPKEALFRPFHRIAFATDWHNHSPKALDQLIVLARHFKAHLDIIHVSQKHGKPMEEVSRQTYDLGEVSHTFYYLWVKEIEEGLQQHLVEHQNDLIVLVPHHHTFFDWLFQKSVTRQMAYHTQIPLLTLKE
uniref:Universal stress protein n=1 Tax=Roseihalotalea indica TaxID=2867963 RepID=A0AA49GLV5_9BACT|nr:universal stress protein [Tunicatimonas sp. TK19036]